MKTEDRNRALWHEVLHDGYREMLIKQRVFRIVPSNPRCSMCYSPFAGLGGLLLRVFMRRERSNYNPRMCNACEYMVRKYPGGAEVNLTMLFADVRGSTTIAEKLSPIAFSQLMDRFYTVSTTAVAQTRGLIEKFVGDNATVLFPPGISGADHAKKAIQTARLILLATGHASPEGPWLPVGAGVNTGNAFVGSVGSGGVSQLTALGDTVNTAARLSSQAATGEILVSEETAKAADLDSQGMERRELPLKGRIEPVHAYLVPLS